MIALMETCDKSPQIITSALSQLSTGHVITALIVLSATQLVLSLVTEQEYKPVTSLPILFHS